MRWITRVVLWLLVITTSRAADDEEMLRNAMEHMLQIRPPRDLHPEDTSNEESAAPNLYMIELYKKYLTSDSMKTRSNTIRSIIPQRGRVGSGEEMLLFNLSGLSGSEEISSAELHFYKRRAISSRKSKLLLPNHHHFLQGFLLMGSDDDTDENTPQSHSSKDPERIGHWEVALEKRGWQVYDVSSAFQRRQPLMRQLGFNFLGASKRRPILPLETVMRMDPTPFLVIYSNERSNASLAAPQDLNALPDENDLAQKENRQRRSIDDNELPEADHHQNGGQYVNSNVIPLTSPGVLQGRGRTGAGGKISGQGKTATAGSSSSSRSSSSSSSSSSSTLPYPKAGSTLDWPTEDKGTGKKTTRTSAAAGSSSTSGSRKGKRRNRKLPETWHYNQQQHVNDARLDVPEDAGRSLCQRRKLTVDFHEIGWGEWIISPKTFEAQYCAGRCPFPLTKELNPTNHATIQSIVHAIGGHPEVPAPCCVPDVLSSLTLLYFDDNRNVVLKNYPSMTAESCACR